MIRYQLALLGHSQRYLPPALVFLGLLAVLYTDPGAPALPEFAVSAGALAAIACWLTVALVDAEDPVQRLVTLSHARRLSRILAAQVLTVLMIACCLTAISLTWSAFTHRAVTALGFGALAHVACACAGVAIGLPCSRFLVPRIGFTAIAALFALGLVLLVRWVPLVNPMLRAMAGNGSAAVPVLVGFGACVLALMTSAFTVGVLVRRRL